MQWILAFQIRTVRIYLDDLKKSKNQTTFWDGIRNYQARNFLRDDIKKGDGVLFYQSSTDPLAVVGYCEVVKEGYPDHTQFDSKSDHFDPKQKKIYQHGSMVDIKIVKEFKKPVTLDSIKVNPKLKIWNSFNRTEVINSARYTSWVGWIIKMEVN